MDTGKIKSLLSEYDQGEVETFVNYCNKLLTEMKKDGGQWVNKNPWMSKRKDLQLAEFFKLVRKDGLEFDGKHITLQSTGISYDYIAYKNKMFLAYPETLIDVGIVYKDDEFSFKKDSGIVTYTHKINNPFGQSEADMTGCYCVIKNKRGEFLTLLSMSDIDKHRKVAKTDSIWKKWFAEMVMKTVIKKSCKNHFSDIFQNIETLDNEQNDLEQSLDISIETKQGLEAILTVPELDTYYRDNKGKNSGITGEFIKACATRKAAIVKALAEENKNADS